MDQLRFYYLRQLGIEPWILRSSEAIVRQSNESSIIACAPEGLDTLRGSVASCTKCSLHQTRTQTVFARGNPEAKLMIIGEAPGFYEDKQGLPFVGKAGGLLNRMLASIGFLPEDVYIANVLKCRPPDNRDPQVDEIQQCSGYLTQQIRMVNPIVLLAVGRFSGHFLLQQALPLNKMRSGVHEYEGKPVFVTYHPAYLLRNPADKSKAYMDLLCVKKKLFELTG
jgi:uracil-DNA glycosylase family 4